MTTLKEQLRSDLTDALRAHDAVRAQTIRLALTAVTTEEVAGDVARELDDDEVLKVLSKEAKKRREAADAYGQAGRTELADTENAELAVLEAYLPQQLTDDEIRAIVTAAIAEVEATSMGQMGQVMKAATSAAAGRADGSRVAAEVKRQLAAK